MNWFLKGIQMKSLPIVILLMGGLQLIGHAQPNYLADAELVKTLRFVGKQSYQEAMPRLESYSKDHPEDAALVAFYIGECEYALGMVDKAKYSLLRVVQTPFNNQEAYWRLMQIAQKEGNEAEAGEYEKCWKDIAQVASNAYERVKHTPYPPEGVDMEYSFSTVSRPVWTWEGMMLLSSKRADGEFVEMFDRAIAFFNQGRYVEIALEERFNSEIAIGTYSLLSRAYEGKAALLRKQRAKREDVVEAEQLAKHYKWNEFIVKSHRGSSPRDKQ
jgi:tetratricopeptide (TPR) repeat protein